MQSICVSFWNVGMSNLPVGTIRKRVLSTDEARRLIYQARAAKTLLCVADDDLGAPYCKPERARHEELCAALRQHADIDIGLEDFFGRDYSNPLCMARISKERSLLVVNCHYGFDRPAADDATGRLVPESDAAAGRTRRDGKTSLRMSVLPDTIRFYLLEVADEAQPAHQGDDGTLTDGVVEH